MIRVGGYQISSVVNGTFRLDGGAMYGVVPKVLWSRAAEPDTTNRIPLAMRTLLAVDEPAGRVILVDTGAGHKWPVEEAERYDIQTDQEAIARALTAFNLTEADVTDVVVTHLHFDHNGGLTEWEDKPGGKTRLRFPQARHWIHRRHWEQALNPTERDRASFLERDLEALRSPGVLTFVDGDSPAPPFEGVQWFISNGHTPAQLLPLFTDAAGRPKLLFTGDAVPTSGHLRVSWLMAYDLYPLVTVEEKTHILDMCKMEGMALTFPHDIRTAGVELDLSSGHPVIARKLEL